MSHKTFIPSILAEWDYIADGIDESWLPVDFKLKHHGCGGYGCVFPTNAQNIVFKITTDEDEATLVQRILAGSMRLHGMVKYYKILKLRLRMDSMSQWAIWREEVFHMGTCVTNIYLQKDFERLRQIGETLYERIKVKKEVSPYAYKQCAEKLLNYSETEDIGETLLDLLEEGVILGDVSTTNIGIARRGKREMFVIADPGTCAVIHT